MEMPKNKLARKLGVIYTDTIIKYLDNKLADYLKTESDSFCNGFNRAINELRAVREELGKLAQKGKK